LYAAAFLGYDAAELEALPAECSRSFAGVGNPHLIGPIHAGETVVDVGCGAGMDLLLAARRVGRAGKAVGVDMTARMLVQARSAAAAASLDQIEILEGDATTLPLPDASADVVISNGVLNRKGCARVGRSWGECFRPQARRHEGKLRMRTDLREKQHPHSSPIRFQSLQWGMRKAGRMRLPVSLLVAVFLGCGIANAADSSRNSGYFFERAIASKPKTDEIAERIRISKGIDPNQMTELSGMHEDDTFPVDTEAGDDFQDEAYGQLRSEIRMTYAELASARGQADEVRRSLELLRQLVEMSNTLYANGKIDQSQALKAQIEWEQMSQSLLLLEKQEQIFAIRLNLLTGDALEAVIPPLDPLSEYVPALNVRELVEAYKSRLFLAAFAQAANPGAPPTAGEELHGLHSTELESNAFISVSKVSLDNLLLRAHRYRLALIPRAEQAHTARMEAFKTGKVDFSALIEGLREVSGMRREYQALLGEMHVLKAHVESMTGVTLD
jgi:SAM-dependent methyltransferase